MDAIKDAQTWISSHSESASKEEIDEQKAELESIVNPITSKLYGSGKGPTDPEDDDHDEL